MKWIPVLVVVMCCILRTISACPSEVCICKWKGGKQTVECGGRNLNSLPEGMDPGTQVLNFSGNSLTLLQSERFLKMDLINLQKIYLSRNKIQRIHDRTFKGLSNLVELDLSENMLTTIPTESFQDYSSLMRLSLSGNPIRELKMSAFKHLSFLTTLELSNCQIENIENEAFIGMDNLEWLRLDGNRITTIRGNHILPDSLHGIYLQGNRWACDCKLIEMHTWLSTNNVPQIEEPKCVTPTRLAGNTIKSISVEDLACMPFITPTTLYLEIAEGRNISLYCKITSVPEATISWWFQGQILQNDSMLTPNLHLYYYIDEGIEEKRSDLSIYNVNAENNGTFSCVAENAAGRSQANYTIRVIVKEEPVAEKVTFPYEYFLIIVAGAGCMGVILLLIICILICKCRRKSKRRKKKNSGKNVALQLQTSQVKCSSITSDSHEQIPVPKLNGTVNIGQQDMIIYVGNASQSGSHKDPMPPVSAGQYVSPPSARNYQDQNPDLINDAESVNKTRLRGDTDGDGTERGSSGPSSLQESNHGTGEKHEIIQSGVPMVRQIPGRFNAMSTLPRGISRDIYQHQADVHLNPGCFLGQDGYPIEYGMAKITMMPANIPSAEHNVNFYRTLPHPARIKMHSAANPNIRYSREAEFLTRTTPLPFDAYAPTDVRYTAEGYPYTTQQIVTYQDGSQHFPSPPEGYKSDSIAGAMSPVVCCASPVPQQWPSCLPGYHSQIVPIKTQQGHEPKRYPSPQPGLMSPLSNPVVTKRCVGAQTSDPERESIAEQCEEEEEEEENSRCTGETKMRHLTGPLADSPDEGYVGDSQEGSDI